MSFDRFTPENSAPLSEHERFEQMCALLAIGDLPDEDFQHLQRHLDSCPNCRQLYADFCRIGSDDLGFLAAERQSETPVVRREADPFLDRLYRRIATEEAERTGPVPQRTGLPSDNELDQAAAKYDGPHHPGHIPLSRRLLLLLRQPAFAWSLAAILVIAASGVGYRRYEQALTAARSAEDQSRTLRAELEQARQHSGQSTVAEKAQADLLANLNSAKTDLERQLAEANARGTEYQAKAQDLARQLEQATARADLAARNLHDTQTASQAEAAKLSVAEDQVRVAMRQLNDLRDKQTDAILHASDEERQIADLKSQLSAQSASIERTQNAVASTGLKGTELFGARNLHIVDVYDVDGKGNTKRTYGRVYYVEKKLMVFYAFDLETKRRTQVAAGFQAWGYREVGESKPENLGMFRLDDASLNRWTLRVDDPHVLEHIDAVFVTLEPPDGSPSPKGRRLLYASLAGAPNHP